MVAVARITPADHDDWLKLFQQWQRYLSGSLPIVSADG